MPKFFIESNVHLEDPTAFVKELSAIVAAAFERDESFAYVAYSYNPHMLFGGTGGPCAIGSSVYVGEDFEVKNKAVSAAVAPLLEAYLRVPNDRYYIQFDTLTSADIGFKGTVSSQL